MTRKFLRNLTWKADEFGDYWVAELLGDDGQTIGMTGSYYDIDSDGFRYPIEQQKAEIHDEYEIWET